jgi:hypothetical protein
MNEEGSFFYKNSYLIKPNLAIVAFVTSQNGKEI